MNTRPLQLVRRFATMASGKMSSGETQHLYWSVYHPFNFGDWVGPFLYHRITGREAWYGRPSPFSGSTFYMAAGSILSAADANAIVWGSGILWKTDVFARPLRTLAVRGPLSRAAFLRQGYPCPEVFGDPAILLPMFHQPPQPAERFELGVVPHFREFERIRSLYAGMDNVRVIDVRHPVDQVIDAIASCRRIASSSLHGIIVSHAYGIPAGWFTWGYVSGDGVKYDDYFHSAGIVPYAPLEAAGTSPGSLDQLTDLIDAATLPDLTEQKSAVYSSCPFGDSAKSLDLNGGDQ